MALLLSINDLPLDPAIGLEPALVPSLSMGLLGLVMGLWLGLLRSQKTQTTCNFEFAAENFSGLFGADLNDSIATLISGASLVQGFSARSARSAGTSALVLLPSYAAGNARWAHFKQEHERGLACGDFALEHNAATEQVGCSGCCKIF